MKTLALVLLLTFVVPLDSSVAAQTKPSTTQIPDETMKAEFRSVTDSSSITLGANNDGVVVVVLWASWCGPCRLAIKELNSVNKDFAGRGVKVVGLTTEDSKQPDGVHAFLSENNVTFAVAWLEAEHSKVLMGDRDAIPQIWVLAGDGAVAKRFVGWNQKQSMPQLREAIEEALIKAAAR
jgi:thiol-disulfide isomerase/thioredoxin